MGFYDGPITINNGLLLSLDAADKNSYPGSGTIWNDLSGNGNNATLFNTPTFNSGNGGHIVFNGTNQYASVSNSATLNRGGGSFTGEVWLAVASSKATERLIFEYNTWSNTGTYQLTALNATTPNITFPEANTAGKNLGPTYSTLSSNVWIHLVGQFDTTNNVFNMYANGVSLGQTTAVTQEIGNVTSTLYIMSRGGSSLFMDAKLAVLKIYSYVLSPSEVLQNYNAQKSRFGL